MKNFKHSHFFPARLTYSSCALAMLMSLSLGVFLIAVLLISAILLWPIDWLVGLWTDYPLHKLLGHLTLLVGLIGSFIYLRIYGLATCAAYGYQVAGGGLSFAKSVAIGLLIGNLIVLCGVEIPLFGLGLHKLAPDMEISLQTTLRLLMASFITGIVVGFLEETIFRGAIQSVLMKYLPVVVAIVIVSLIYAALHFLKFPRFPAEAIPAWDSGLVLLVDGLNPSYLVANLDSFFTLLLLGILLGVLRVINGNIAFCIGVHTGLVMMMKISRKWFDHVPGSELEFLINHSDHQLGLLSSVVFMIMIVFITKNRERIQCFCGNP